MNQAQLQNELNARAWSNTTYTLPAGASIDIHEPLYIEGCVLQGPLVYGTAHPRKELSSFKIHHKDGPGIIIRSPYGGIQGCAITYPQQTRSNIIAYPPTIKSKNGGALIRSITITGAYDGIMCEDAGHTVVEDIWMQVVHIGVEIRDARDITRLNRLHLWPNWDVQAVEYAYYPPGNGRGIILAGVDWCYADDIFVYGAHVGMQIIQSRGIGTGLRAGILQFDACSNGLDVYSIAHNDVVMINMLKVAGNTTHGGAPITGIIARGAGHNGRIMIGMYHVHGEVATPIVYDNINRNRVYIGKIFS